MRSPPNATIFCAEIETRVRGVRYYYLWKLHRIYTSSVHIVLYNHNLHTEAETESHIETHMVGGVPRPSINMCFTIERNRPSRSTHICLPKKVMDDKFINDFFHSQFVDIVLAVCFGRLVSAISICAGKCVHIDITYGYFCILYFMQMKCLC